MEIGNHISWEPSPHLSFHGIYRILIYKRKKEDRIQLDNLVRFFCIMAILANLLLNSAYSTIAIATSLNRDSKAYSTHKKTQK